MKSLLWILIHVASAVILAVIILRDVKNTVNEHIAREDEESTRDEQITDAINDKHGQR